MTEHEHDAWKHLQYFLKSEVINNGKNKEASKNREGTLAQEVRYHYNWTIIVCLSQRRYGELQIACNSRAISGARYESLSRRGSLRRGVLFQRYCSQVYVYYCCRIDDRSGATAAIVSWYKYATRRVTSGVSSVSSWRLGLGRSLRCVTARDVASSAPVNFMHVYVRRVHNTSLYLYRHASTLARILQWNALHNNNCLCPDSRRYRCSYVQTACAQYPHSAGALLKREGIDRNRHSCRAARIELRRLSTFIFFHCGMNFSAEIVSWKIRMIFITCERDSIVIMTFF